jgi:hypothetical protein
MTDRNLNNRLTKDLRKISDTLDRISASQALWHSEYLSVASELLATLKRSCDTQSRLSEQLQESDRRNDLYRVEEARQFTSLSHVLREDKMSVIDEPLLERLDRSEQSLSELVKQSAQANVKLSYLTRQLFEFLKLYSPNNAAASPSYKPRREEGTNSERQPRLTNPMPRAAEVIPPDEFELKICQAFRDSAEEFRRMFAPQLFALRNVHTTLMDSSTKPEFVLDESGPYCLILRAGDQEGYAVPRPDFVLEASYRAAMKAMFELNGFRDGYRYRRLFLRKPARCRVIRGDPTRGARVEIIAKGVIDVADAQPESM